MSKKNVLAVLALSVSAWMPAGLSAAIQIPVILPPVCVNCQVSNLTFDHAMLFNLVNAAIANSGTIKNFTTMVGQNAGIVSVSIHNSGPVAAICYLIPVVRQGGAGAYNCDPQGNVATGPLVQTVKPVPAGQTVQVNIGGLELAPNGNGGSYNGTFCTNLQNLVGNNFGGNNNNNNNNNNGGNGSGSGSSGSSNVLSTLGSVVHELQELQVNVCAAVANSSDTPIGNMACTQIGIFEQPSSVATQSAILIYPNNAILATPLPSFIWTPALYNGSTLGITYELVLSQSPNGNPWYGIQIPAGQTYYQYQATDRVLGLGQKFWWHVVALQGVQPVGGQNGQGWSQPQGTFTYSPMGAPSAGAAMSLSALSQLIQTNASAAVLKALAGMQLQSAVPSGALSDPDVAALLAKPSEIKNISVEKF